MRNIEACPRIALRTSPISDPRTKQTMVAIATVPELCTNLTQVGSHPHPQSKIIPTWKSIPRAGPRIQALDRAQSQLGAVLDGPLARLTGAEHDRIEEQLIGPGHRIPAPVIHRQPTQPALPMVSGQDPVHCRS